MIQLNKTLNMINAMIVHLRLINRSLDRELRITNRVLSNWNYKSNVRIMSNASEDNPINAYQSLRNIKSRLLSISKSMDS